jgi:hypothetical protein
MRRIGLVHPLSLATPDRVPFAQLDTPIKTETALALEGACLIWIVARLPDVEHGL